MDNIKQVLIDAKKSLIDEIEKEKEINVLKGKIATYEQKIQDLEKAKIDCIDKKVKEEKANIAQSYDDLINNTTTKIKDIKEKKEKEIKKHKKEQIENNTSAIKDNNTYLKNRIKQVIKENKLPFFINTNFYFSLFKYENGMSIIRGFFICLIFLVIVPFIILYFIFLYKYDWWKIINTNIITKIGFFILNLFIWGIIYIVIDKFSKVDDEKLKEIKTLRSQIRENLNDIKNITNKINNDKVELNFDYSQYDRDIEQSMTDLNILKEKKEAALENFQAVIEKEITANIEAEANKDINEEQNNLQKAQIALDRELINLENIKIEIRNRYENVIGEEYIKTETLDRLIDILNKNEEMDLEAAKQLLKKFK